MGQSDLFFELASPRAPRGAGVESRAGARELYRPDKQTLSAHADDSLSPTGGASFCFAARDRYAFFDGVGWSWLGSPALGGHAGEMRLERFISAEMQRFRRGLGAGEGEVLLKDGYLGKN